MLCDKTRSGKGKRNQTTFNEVSSLNRDLLFNRPGGEATGRLTLVIGRSFFSWIGNEMTSRIQSLDWIDKTRCDAAHCDDTMVVLDFSHVQRINTQQLGELIRLHRSIKRSGRQLVLENVSESILQVLAMTRLDRLLRINLDSQASSLLLRPTYHRRQVATFSKSH